MNITLPKELSALLETETIELIDVRNKSEYDEVHIPLAKLIPLHLLPLKWKEIDTKKSIICICRSGGRSGQACTFLSTVGITASNFVGGMNDFEKEFPLEVIHGEKKKFLGIF